MVYSPPPIYETNALSTRVSAGFNLHRPTTALSIFRSGPTRTTSVNPSLSKVVSRRSTATLVCADTSMRALLPSAARRQGQKDHAKGLVFRV
jgi:hypothetical protein